jgi:hypothetical protein
MLSNLFLSAAVVVVVAVVSTKALIAEGFTDEQLVLMRQRLVEGAHQR